MENTRKGNVMLWETIIIDGNNGDDANVFPLKKHSLVARAVKAFCMFSSTLALTFCEHEQVPSQQVPDKRSGPKQCQAPGKHVETRTGNEK